MQSWDMTEIAVDTILQEHHPKTAILVMDYYNMNNIIADTKMRENLADGE